MTRADAARAVTKLTGHRVNEDTLRRYEEQELLPSRGPGSDESGYSVWDVARACSVATLRLGPANMGTDGVRLCLRGLDGLRDGVEAGSVRRIAATPDGARALDTDAGMVEGFVHVLPIRDFMLGLRFEDGRDEDENAHD